MRVRKAPHPACGRPLPAVQGEVFTEEGSPLVDYRKFLGKTDTLIAPWFGGPSIDAPGRRLKLSQPPPKLGWYRLELKGRIATPKEPADPPDLSALPKVRGFLWRDRLVGDNAKTEPLYLLPEEEPPRRARRCL